MKIITSEEMLEIEERCAEDEGVRQRFVVEAVEFVEVGLPVRLDPAGEPGLFLTERISNCVERGQAAAWLVFFGD